MKRSVVPEEQYSSVSSDLRVYAREHTHTHYSIWNVTRIAKRRQLTLCMRELKSRVQDTPSSKITNSYYWQKSDQVY